VIRFWVNQVYKRCDRALELWWLSGKSSTLHIGVKWHWKPCLRRHGDPSFVNNLLSVDGIKVTEGLGMSICGRSFCGNSRHHGRDFVTEKQSSCLIGSTRWTSRGLCDRNAQIIPYYRLSWSTWPLSNNKEVFYCHCWVMLGKSLTTEGPIRRTREGGVNGSW
jgi:hypothetical protein